MEAIYLCQFLSIRISFIFFLCVFSSFIHCEQILLRSSQTNREGDGESLLPLLDLSRNIEGDTTRRVYPLIGLLQQLVT